MEHLRPEDSSKSDGGRFLRCRALGRAVSAYTPCFLNVCFWLWLGAAIAVCATFGCTFPPVVLLGGTFFWFCVMSVDAQSRSVVLGVAVWMSLGKESGPGGLLFCGGCPVVFAASLLRNVGFEGCG